MAGDILAGFPDCVCQLRPPQGICSGTARRLHSFLGSSPRGEIFFAASTPHGPRLRTADKKWEDTDKCTTNVSFNFGNRAGVSVYVVPYYRTSCTIFAFKSFTSVFRALQPFQSRYGPFSSPFLFSNRSAFLAFSAFLRTTTQWETSKYGSPLQDRRIQCVSSC